MGVRQKASDIDDRTSDIAAGFIAFGRRLRPASASRHLYVVGRRRPPVRPMPCGARLDVRCPRCRKAQAHDVFLRPRHVQNPRRTLRRRRSTSEASRVRGLVGSSPEDR